MSVKPRHRKRIAAYRRRVLIAVSCLTLATIDRAARQLGVSPLNLIEALLSAPHEFPEADPKRVGDLVDCA